MNSRRNFLLSVALCAALAACGGDGGAVERTNGEIETDRAIGSPGAPVTIIEYASVMCPHCRTFHVETLPALKEKYVDTGKVRFIFREIPTHPADLAMAGFLLARCAPENKYFDVLDVLFQQQGQLYAASRSPAGAREDYLRIARAVGINESQFNACVSDRDEIARIDQVGVDGKRQYGIESTPSFVINGETYVGAMPLEDFEDILAPLLGEEAPSDDEADAADG